MGSESERENDGPTNNTTYAHVQQADLHPSRSSTRKFPVSLRKELGIISSVGLVFGNVIGSGIFITTSTILGYTQSFGLTLITWVVGGLITTAGALCYCELGTMIHKSGSEYAYILEAYSFGGKNKYLRIIGQMLAFTNVWYDFLVGNPASLAIPLLTFGRYASRPFFIGCPELPVLPVKMLALVALIVSTVVNIYSVKWASRVATALSFLKFVSLAFVVVLGVYYIADTRCFSKDSSTPFAGTTTDVSSIALALTSVMYAYDGWDALNMMQEEASNIVKVLPRTILISMPLIILSYAATNTAFFAVLSYDQIRSAEAVGLMFGDVVIGRMGLVIFPLLVALATFSSAHVSLMTQSRKLFVASRDGIMPDLFGGVHNHYRTPIPAVLCITIFSAVLICIGTIDQIIDAFVATVWFFSGLAIVGLFIMRLTQSERKRPFKVWLILPSFMLLAIVFVIVMPLLQNAVPQLIAFAGTSIGMPIYFILVMETPWKIRPKILDRLSGCATAFVNNLFGTKSTRSSFADHNTLSKNRPRFHPEHAVYV